MSLADIRAGLGAAPSSGLSQLFSEPFIATAQKAAVLASTKDYEDSFARLSVFQSNTANFRTVQSFDSIIQNQGNVVIDYLLLQGIAETFVERVSPMYSFGSSLLYTAGSDAKSFSYSAVILSDKITGDNATRFTKSYKNALRASELVNPENPGYVELSYRDQIRRGFLTQLSVQKNSDRPNEVTINFSMFVADYFSTKQKTN